MSDLDRLRTIFELAPVGIGIVDLQGKTVMTNEILRRSLGYTAEEFATLHFSEFTHPDDIAANDESFARMAEGRLDSFALEKRFIRKDGAVVWADLTVSLVRDGAGQPDYAIGMTQDITERKRLESELRAAERRHRHLVERVPAVVYVADTGADGRFDYVSPQVEGMFGFRPEEWVADAGLWRDQLDPRDAELVLAARERGTGLSGSPETSSLTYRIRHRDGATVWVRDDAIVLRDSGGQARFHGVLVDVTREKDLEARLEHQALHDPLTGLPNRTLFHDRVAHALARARRNGGDVTVLFIDLDDFKTVNDSFGHACGDAVIVAAAKRLRACVRSADTAARLGGDEFALLLEGATATSAAVVARTILLTLNASAVEVGGRAVAVSASIGIATAGPVETTETLLRNADLAMYQAKKQGRARWAVYDPRMHANVVGRFRLEAALQAAVTAGAVGLHYQPIVELATGTVVGLEALARWTDPDLGAVPPAEFIPIAEETGLIHELGQRLIEQSCRDLRDWRRTTGADAYVSVNVSPMQLDNDLFPTLVLRALSEHGLSPRSLVLEVTEGLLLAARSRESLRALRASGIRVAIDDFGTGYSSLSYLRQLPVDMVKIDQSFLRPVQAGADETAFLSAIVQLSRTLGLFTICEGVETGAHLDELARAGCGLGQGYLLARPGPIPAIPARIAACGTPAPALEHCPPRRDEAG